METELETVRRHIRAVEALIGRQLVRLEATDDVDVRGHIVGEIWQAELTLRRARAHYGRLFNPRR